MRRYSPLSAVVALVVISGCSPASDDVQVATADVDAAQAQPSATDAVSMTDSTDVVALASDQVEWQDNGRGTLMAILYGDPSSEGHYVVRFKLPPHWEAPRHIHRSAQTLTIHSGTMYFALGEDLSRQAVKAFGPGSFIAFPAGTGMYEFTGDEEVVLEIQGRGPSTTQPLN